MDSFGVTSISLSLVISGLELYNSVFRLQEYHRDIIPQLYGPKVGFLIFTFFRSTASEYRRLQRVVLLGGDEETLRFRDSVINECNMTAVAVRLIVWPVLAPF